MSTSGIYEIRNIVTNSYYVGSSYCIEKRWAEHKNLLKGNKHHNAHFQHSWNKYGGDKFVFTILLRVKPSRLLIEEQQRLDKSLGDPQCLNISYNAAAPMTGRRHSAATRLLFKKRHMSIETRRKMSEARRGQKRSAASKLKMSRAQQGEKHPGYDWTRRIFHNTKTNETFHGTRYEFYTKYQLKAVSVTALVHRRITSLYNWIITPCTQHSVS